MINLLKDWLNRYPLQKVIAGYPFKPEITLLDGSPALLLANLIRDEGGDVELWDPLIDGDKEFDGPRCFLIGCCHRTLKDKVWPSGSVVIDPHRYIPKSSDYTVVHLGT